MGWFSSVTGAVKKGVSTATKVALLPTTITARLASKVVPRPVGRLISGAANLPNAAVNRALSTLAPSRRAALPAPSYSRGAAGFQPPPRPAASFINAFAQPTAYPSSGQILAPAAVQAVVNQQPQAPTSSVSTGWGGGGGGGGYGGGGGGYGGDEYAEDGGGAEGDPTEDMPDQFFETSEEDGGYPDLGDIDYRAALGGLGDWKSDLKSFGKQVGTSVGKQALVAVGNKLTGSKPIAPPPPSPGLPMAAKVAIGGAAVLGVALLVSGRHGSSSSAT